MKPSGWFGFVNGVYWLLLGLWVGSLVLSAATAAMMFPMMKFIAPVLPEYAAYTGSHGLLLAGQIMSRVFFVQDAIELAAIVGVSVILVGHFVAFRLSARTVANRFRLAAGAVLLVIVCYKAFILAPRMYYHLGDFWAAAKAGDMAKADAAHAAFEADHPTATNLMVATLGGLIVFIFASASALSGTVMVVAEKEVKPRGVQLEEPALLHQMRR